MSSPSREEIALQFQDAVLQVDKDLLATLLTEAEFRAEIKVMIAHQGETFQMLRTDINKAVGEAGLNVGRLHTEMHTESSVNRNNPSRHGESSGPASAPIETPAGSACGF